ncbi:MAG: hypothetical protein L3J14_05315 [Flavobacteriaceae bacterium]|nr:hypothetical protein [Flavobacteriaceae bacterium]
MSTKKTKNTGITTKFNNAINTTKTAVKDANKFALNNTEEVVTESINAAKQWQEVTSKALEGGFKLMENQQNLVFDTLESFKKQFIQGKKKLTKVFA